MLGGNLPVYFIQALLLVYYVQLFVSLLGLYLPRFFFLLEDPSGVNTTKDSQIEGTSADVMDTS